MARIPRAAKAAPVVDPLAWIYEGRWQGCRRFSIHEHECDRALWFGARWATPGTPPVRHLSPLHLGVIVQPAPPPILEGLMASLCCGTCPHAAVCQGTELAYTCRTCADVVADGAWHCRRYQDVIEPELQRVGCDAWGAVA